MADLNLSILLQAIDRFSEPAKKVTAVSDKLAAHLKAGQKALNKLGEQSKLIERLKGIEQRLGKTASELDQARRRTAELGRELAATDKPTKKLQQVFEQAKRKSSQLKEAHRAQREELQRLRSELREAGIDTRSLADAEKTLAGRAEQAAEKMKRLSETAAKVERLRANYDRSLQTAANVSLVAGGLRHVGQQLTQALTGPLRQAIDFESAMADVRKVVNFAEPDGLKKLSARLVEMTRTIPITKEGLAAIAASGGQLGVKADDLPSFVETVAKMATAFDMLPDEAGDAMAKLSNVYQIPIEQMGALGDAINHLSDNTAARARDIVPALQRIGGVARQFGLGAEQAAALADAFIALGKPPEVAATAINALLNKLQTASEQGEKFQSALDEIGLSADGLQQAIGDDAQGALTDFLARVGQLDKQTRAGILMRLFGQEYADDIALLTGSLEQYQKALALVGERTQFAGSMEREFQNRANTTANRLQLLQQRWDALQMRLGERLLPVLESLTNALGPIIDAIGKFIEDSPGATKWMMLLAGGVGAISLVVAPLITGLASAAAGIAWLTYVIKKLRMESSLTAASGRGKGGGLWGRLKGMGKYLKGKAGWIGAGLGAISIGSTLLDKSQSAGEKAGEITQSLGGIGGSLAGAAAGAALGSVVPVIGTAIGGLLGSIVGGLSGDWVGGKLGNVIARWIGGGSEKGKVGELAKAGALAATVAAAPAVAAPIAPVTVPEPPAQTRQTVVNNTDNSTITITVHQQPGEDAEALAQRVAEILREQRRVERTGALYDLEDG